MIVQQYEVLYLDIKVVFNFGVFDVLMQQIVKGVFVDVFVFVDQEVMNKVVVEKVIKVEMCYDFVVNWFVLIVLVVGMVFVYVLIDFMRFDVKCVVIGNLVLVLVGCYVKCVLEVVKLWELVEVKVVLVQNVWQVLDYVFCGEVEVGLVFFIDVVIVVDKVKVVSFVLLNVLFMYLIVVIFGMKQLQLVVDFVVYVLLLVGQLVLVWYGFLKF